MIPYLAEFPDPIQEFARRAIDTAFIGEIPTLFMEFGIITDQLSKIYGGNTEHPVVAVDNLSMQLPAGKIIGLLGPNGAGKTTTIRLVASLLSPTSGTAKVLGHDSHSDSLKVRSLVGLSHEKPSFYKGLTGRRNLEFYGELYDVPKDDLHVRIDQLAIDFDLADAIDHPVGSYSKGMMQKLSVCKALIHDAPVIILDEPWSGLSPGATRDLRRRIKQLGLQQGKTILITTHNLAQAELVVDELIIIAKGQVIAQGTPQQLRDRYHVTPELLVQLATPMQLDLQELDYVAEVSVASTEDSMVIKIEDFKHTPKLISYLVSKGARIREVREQVPSLEEIYLQLVEVDQQ